MTSHEPMRLSKLAHASSMKSRSRQTRSKTTASNMNSYLARWLHARAGECRRGLVIVSPVSKTRVSRAYHYTLQLKSRKSDVVGPLCKGLRRESPRREKGDFFFTVLGHGTGHNARSSVSFWCCFLVLSLLLYHTLSPLPMFREALGFLRVFLVAKSSAFHTTPTRPPSPTKDSTCSAGCRCCSRRCEQ